MPDVTRIQRKEFATDLDEIAREGARRMLVQALEAEVADYIARNQERDEQGRAQSATARHAESTSSEPSDRLQDSQRFHSATTLRALQPSRSKACSLKAS